VLKKNVLKIIASLIAVPVFGMILLNVAFLLDALYQSVVRTCVGFFIPLGPDMKIYWFPPLMHISYLVIILVITFFVFRSKLAAIYKAIFMIVPLAAVSVTMGMLLYQWPYVVYSVGGLFFIGVIYLLYRTKKPWIYFYSAAVIGMTMLMIQLLGVEI